MNFVLFCHSLVSCWNHGNAHFLRGVVDDLLERGHRVTVYEPADGWSRQQLLAEQGVAPVAAFHAAYPRLRSVAYSMDSLDLDRALDGADVVLVHEWNDPALVARVGAHGRGSRARVLFHDTHHRSVTDPDAMRALDLRDYDGVLAFGQTVADRYVAEGWARRVWVWHEAADTRRFRPLQRTAEGDLVWIGNWGDDERTHELHEFLLRPVTALRLRARIHGVRYPQAALDALSAAGIQYAGWLPNHRAPDVFAAFRCTVHVPRRAYAERLPGIPTIRMFEALACGIPLVSAPWQDPERLFTPGRDFLVARSGAEMRAHLAELLAEPAYAREVAEHGRATIDARHTCAHRVDELLAIVAALDRRPDGGAVHPTPLRHSAGA
jgi:spore maturation protein CgeB